MVVVSLGALAGAGTAWAQDAEPEDDAGKEAPAAARPRSDWSATEEAPLGPGFNHKGQIGLHLQGGVGYRGIFPYDEEFCGELKDDGGNRSPCLDRSPFTLDIGLGYGVARMVELFLEISVGLEKDVGVAPGDEGPHGVALSPGIKAYLGELGHTTRFFSTLQLPIDFTSFDQVDKNDLGIRNINGVQIDLHRTFGLYVFFGEQVSWRRWLRFEINAGLGAQVRFP